MRCAIMIITICFLSAVPASAGLPDMRSEPRVEVTITVTGFLRKGDAPAEASLKKRITAMTKDCRDLAIKQVPADLTEAYTASYKCTQQ